MKQKRVFLLCGPQASGKSTWAKNRCAENEGVIQSVYISRDQERFKLVKENEDYFSKEKEVFNSFVKHINNAISNHKIEEIYIDATHINEASRKKLLKNINIDSLDVIVVVFETPLEECIQRNAKREGRECVPEKVIRDTFRHFKDPVEDDILYQDIWYIKNNIIVDKESWY